MKPLPRPLPLLALALPLVLAALPAQAQYKVVGPDGKVTYTDRPAEKATAVRGIAATPAPALPADLAAAVASYPVTLYTSPDCQVCDTGRQLLRKRGVPHTEKSITTIDEGRALARITGGPEVPTLTIGTQALRGLNTDTWTRYLDAAGYPSASKLPSSYAFAPATPMIEPPAPAPAPGSESRAVLPPPAPPSGDNPGGIRF